MEVPLKLLIVDDSESDAELVAEALRDEGYNVVSRRVDTRSGVLDALGGGSWDLAIVDRLIPGFDGIDAVGLIKSRINVPTIMMSGKVGEEAIVDAIKSGADDYVLKGDNPRLFHIVKRELFSARERLALKRAVEDREDSEHRYRVLFENSLHGVFLLHFGGELIDVNPEMEKITGYPVHELTGMKLADILDEEGGSRVDADLKQIAASKGVASNFECRLRRKDGRWIFVEIETFVVARAGSRFAVEGFINDISGRKKLESELMESRESFINLVEKNADGIAVTDGSGKVMYHNKAARVLFDANKWLFDGSRLLLNTASSNVLEFNIVRFNGDSGRGEARVEPTGWEGNDALLVTFRDVTERAVYENSLLKTAEELKRLDRMKTDFISIASHELRTPMASIKNAINILSSGKAGELSGKQAHFTEMAERNVFRLDTIISDLLDLSRIEAGKMELNLSEIKIPYLFESVLAMFKVEAASKNISLETSIAQDLPAAFIDETRIERVLINLMANAMRYTPAGGSVTLIAGLAGQTEGSKPGTVMLELSVADTGKGMAEEDVTRIFDKYYQAGNKAATPQEYKGMGLGLNICSQLVDAHGGRICCKSAPGKGAVFTFTVPAFDYEAQFFNGLQDTLQNSGLKGALVSVITVKFGDLDRFMTILDEGKDIDDQLCKMLGGVLRGTDQIQLLKSHGEIVIVMPGADSHGALAAASRVSRLLDGLDLQALDDGSPQKISIGSATYPDDGLDGRNLVAVARKRLV